MLELTEELELVEDPSALEGDLISVGFETVTVFEALAARPGLSQAVQLHLASRVGGTRMSFTSGDAPPGVRCARAFFPVATDPLAVEAAAASLGSCSDSGRSLDEVTLLLLASPGCTERARMAAIWSLVVENSYYRRHLSEDVDLALRRLVGSSPLVRLAAHCAEQVVSSGPDDLQGRYRCPVGRFVPAVVSLGRRLGSPEAIEAYTVLRCESDAEDALLVAAVTAL